MEATVRLATITEGLEIVVVITLCTLAVLFAVAYCIRLLTRP